MTDGQIKGTGNSRFLKTVSDFLTRYPTYQDFATAFVAGTLPVDINGINAAGWNQLATALNKANLLADATAALFGLTSTATPNSVFSKISTLFGAFPEASKVAMVETGSYTGKTYLSTDPIQITLQGSYKAWISCSNSGDSKDSSIILASGQHAVQFTTSTSGYAFGYPASASFNTSTKTLTLTTSATNGWRIGTQYYIAFTTK